VFLIGVDRNFEERIIEVPQTEEMPKPCVPWNFVVRFFLKKLLPSVRVPLPARQRARDRLLWSILELNLQLQPVAGLALVKAVR
ncbi:unnamed protein product, partial [Durusdinium trenchii]